MIKEDKKAKQAAYMRKYRAEHKESVAKHQHNCYMRHREARLQYKRDYVANGYKPPVKAETLDIECLP